jgi:hypothetical protein
MTSTPQPRRQYRRWLRLLQIVGTLILSVILARSVDWSRAGELLLNLRWEFISLAALMLLAAHLTNTARWRYLLWPAQVPYTTLLGYYGAGLFSNNFLPTGMGGDGVRAAFASRHAPGGRAILSVALDRSLGLAALFAFIPPGLWIGLPPNLALPAGWLSWQLWVTLGLGGIGGLASLALLWHHAPKLRQRVADLYTRWFALPAYTSLPLWRYWTRQLGGGMLFSCASIIFMILANMAFLAAVGLMPSHGAALWLVVLSSLSLLAPIAVNGLGVMESVYVFVLAGYGVAGSAALSIALLARLFIVFYSLIGGLISLRQSVSRPGLDRQAPSAGPQP